MFIVHFVEKSIIVMKNVFLIMIWKDNVCWYSLCRLSLMDPALVYPENKWTSRLLSWHQLWWKFHEVCVQETCVRLGKSRKYRRSGIAQHGHRKLQIRRRLVILSYFILIFICTGIMVLPVGIIAESIKWEFFLLINM